MGIKTEKYTNRDLMLKMVDAQHALLAHFNNGKFVESLKLGIKEQTKEIIKEVLVIQETTKETKGVIGWMRYTAFGIIGLLSTVNLALIGLYVRELLLKK